MNGNRTGVISGILKQFFRAAVGVWLCLGSCQENRGPQFEPEPVIFAVLRAGDSLQKIIVDQTYGIEDSVAQSGVTGARVWVFGNGDSIRFSEQPDTEGVYTAFVDTNWLAPTTDYRLQVVLPWAPNDTVKAQTRVPGRFRIIAPTTTDTVRFQQLPVLTWSASLGVYLYHVWIYPLTDSLGIDSLPLYNRIPQSASDTVLNLSELQSYFMLLDTIYIIRVAASEENTYRYMREDTTTNISWGFGLFGGIAEDSVKIFIQL